MIYRAYPYFGEPGINPGDLVVELGVRTLGLRPDDVIIAGTPWLWDGCERSAKYKLLAEIAALPGRKVALGIGSCLRLGLGIEQHLPHASPTIADCWRMFDVITTRDSIAHEWLNALGIDNALLPCPSVLSGIGDVHVHAGSTIYVGIDPDDIPENCHVLHYGRGNYDEAGIRSLFDFIGSHETIITDRVHSAVPFGGRRRIAIKPRDSRYLTATLIGIPTLPAPPAMGPIDLDQIRIAYNNLVGI